MAIIDNILSENEIASLKNYIYPNVFNKNLVYPTDEELKTGKYGNLPQIEKDLGRVRYQTDSDNIPNSIKNKFCDIANSFNSKSRLDSATFARYSKEYGKPRLGPHIDKHNNNVTIFYQLDSNINWKLFVQTEPVELNNNEGMILNTRNVIHWREPRIFKDGEYTEMIFFHFNDGTESFLTKEERILIGRPWDSIYNRLENELNTKLNTELP